MKITDVKTTVVNVPFTAPWLSSLGVADGTTRTIVELTTDDGHVGFGEAPFSECKRVIDERLKKEIVGADPFLRREIAMKCLPSTGSMGAFALTSGIDIMAYSGVDMALLDLIGKSLRRPVYEILGGQVREKVPFVEYFAPRYPSPEGKGGGELSPAKIAEYCGEMVSKHHSRIIEGKVGVLRPEDDVATVKLIRETVGPSIEIRVDANTAWSRTTAIKTIRAMERYDVSNVEEPTRGLEGLALVRERVNSEISTHSLSFAEIARLKAADNVVCDYYETGGFENAALCAAVADRLSLGFWLRSDGELGISTAAYLHLAATVPSMVHPNQSLARYLVDDIIQGGPLVPEDGYLTVPRSIGLGVEIDRAKLAKYAELYEKKGSYNWHEDQKRGKRLNLNPQW